MEKWKSFKVKLGFNLTTIMAKPNNPLKNETFYKILTELCQKENYAYNLYEKIGLSHQAVFKSLNKMVDIGLIPQPTDEKLLNKKIYSFNEKKFIDFIYKYTKIKIKNKKFNVLLIEDIKSPHTPQIYNIFDLIKINAFQYGTYELIRLRKIPQIVKDIADFLKKDENDNYFWHYLQMVRITSEMKAFKK